MRGRMCGFGGGVAIAAIALSASVPCAAQNGEPHHPPTPAAGDTVARTAEALDDFVAHQAIEPDVARQLRALYPALEANLKDGNGWLLYVEMFADVDGNLHAGRSRPVRVLAQGLTANDAAMNYYLTSDLPEPPLAGMLSSDEQSYIIWASRGGNGILFSKTGYPLGGVILDTGSRAAESLLAAARTEAAIPAADQRQPNAGDSSASAGDPHLDTLMTDTGQDLQKLTSIRQGLQTQLREVDRDIEIAERRKGEIADQIRRGRLWAETGQQRVVIRPLPENQDQETFQPAPAPRIAAIRVSVRHLPVPEFNLAHDPPPAPVTAHPQREEQPETATAASADGTDGAPAPDRKPLLAVMPRYPTGAENDQAEGYVDFEFSISKDGAVVNPRVLAEAPLGHGFANAARTALMQWRFSPLAAGEMPSESPVSYRFNFKLGK